MITLNLNMRRPLSLSLLFVSLFGYAQQPDWLVSWPVNYSSNPGMPRHVLAASDNGNLMSARVLDGTFNYGQDIYGSAAVDRMDPATGQALWSCLLLDSANIESGAVDASGNVYLAGRFMGELEVCDGSILAHTGTWWDVDLFLMKFDPNGAVLWSRNLSLAIPDMTTATALAIDPNEDLWYATGDFMLARFARVDAQGNDLEVRYMDGAKTIGGMDFDPAGGLYVSGGCDNNAFAFGGLNPVLPANDPYLMYLARYKPDGTGDWAHFAHDITFQFPNVAADDLGHAYLAGNMFDTTSWGGIPFNGPDWVSGVFLAKVDSTGQFLWGVESDPAGGTINGDFEAAARACVAVDGDGNPYLTGTLRGLVDWGNGVVSDGITLGMRTQTIVSFDPAGTPVWASTSFPTASFVQTLAITAMDDGTLHFSSHVSGQFDFAPLSTNIGGQQAYVIGRFGGTSTATEDLVTVTGTIAFPSPFTEAIHLAPAPPADARITVTDAMGRMVQTGRYTGTLGEGWDPGMYALEVRTGDERTVLRVVKQ
jgi:hypothetical protein